MKSKQIKKKPWIDNECTGKQEIYKLKRKKGIKLQWIESQKKKSTRILEDECLVKHGNFLTM